VAAIFAAAASSARAAAVPRRDPETEDFAEAFAGDFFGGAADFFDFAGIGAPRTAGKSRIFREAFLSDREPPVNTNPAVPGSARLYSW